MSDYANIVVICDGDCAWYYVNGQQITWHKVGDGVILFADRLEVKDAARIEYLTKFLRFVGAKI